MSARGQREQKAARALQALDLRIAGGTYRQIARQLGVNEKTAFYDVQGALASLDAVKAKTAERLRDIELERLDRASTGLVPGIRSGDARAVTALVRVMERRAKLLGLDAPVKQSHEMPEPIKIVWQMEQ
jgi:hypothetical protein